MNAEDLTAAYALTWLTTIIDPDGGDGNLHPAGPSVAAVSEGEFHHGPEQVEQLSPDMAV